MIKQQWKFSNFNFIVYQVNTSALLIKCLYFSCAKSLKSNSAGNPLILITCFQLFQLETSSFEYKMICLLLLCLILLFPQACSCWMFSFVPFTFNGLFFLSCPYSSRGRSMPLVITLTSETSTSGLSEGVRRPAPPEWTLKHSSIIDPAVICCTS